MSAVSAADAPAPARHLCDDKAYSFLRNRPRLRRRRISHTFPEPNDQRAHRERRGSKGGRPAGFDKTIHKRGKKAERIVLALENSRAVATSCGKDAYVFHGTVASIRLWLRS